MIKIFRTEPIPNILKQNQEEWTNDLLKLIASTPGGYQGISQEDKKNKIREKYRKKEIQDSLETISHEKCVYCEAPTRFWRQNRNKKGKRPKEKDKVGYLLAQIEHFYPISQEPAQAYEWENLFLACNLCNPAKGWYESQHDLKIDPIVHLERDNPEEYFKYSHVNLIQAAPDSPDPGKSKATILACDLNRIDLTRTLARVLNGSLPDPKKPPQRKKNIIGIQALIQQIYDKVHSYNMATDETEKAYLLRNIHDAITFLEADENEYAGFIRYILNKSPKIHVAKQLIASQ